MVLETRYTELVGCRVPVQQAPMGSVSTSALAVAVADAGGVGSITAPGMTAAGLDKVLAAMTARTTGTLAANFLTGQIDPEAASTGTCTSAAARPVSWAGRSPVSARTCRR
jgi:nitronate monooxygenase